jgi:hypothetical protein
MSVIKSCTWLLGGGLRRRVNTAECKSAAGILLPPIAHAL